MVCDNRNCGVYGKESRVLILILLEYGLRHTLTIEQFKDKMKVLILILLEYGLRLFVCGVKLIILCLNPYSIGIWSATPKIANH